MPLTIYKRGKIWHYRGTVGPPDNRRKLRGSCQTEDKARAARYAAELEAKHWKRVTDGPAAVLTYAQASLLYRSAGRPTRFLADLEDFWRDTPVREITAGTIRQASITLYPNASGATRNRQIITVAQSVINHAAELELCPRIKVRRFPTETKVRHPASWTWVKEFMSASNPNLGALACFMFLTGARITESLSLGWNEVNLSSQRALIRQTKTGTDRLAHIPLALVAALANIPGPREGKVFGYSSRQSVQKPWDRACRRAGIEPLSPHCCRHGFATTLLQAGVSVVDVARLGGWNSPRLVLQTYAHATADLTVTDVLVDTQGTQRPMRRPKVIGE